jgi:hypothetical protein
VPGFSLFIRIGLVCVCVDLTFFWFCFGVADDFDPVQEAREKRKARVGKNEKQRLANLARTQGVHGPLTPAGSKEEKKGQLRSMALQTKTSTASMGR